MTNILEDAADLLDSGHWCAGYIKDGDTFCAIGAVGYEMGLYDLKTEDGAIDAIDVYREFREHPAGKALADEVLASDWYKNIKEEGHAYDADRDDFVKVYYDDGEYDSVVIEFNDNQNNVKPVVELFRKAAARLDS